MTDPSSPSAPATSPATPPWTPDCLIDDRFQVVRELGRGGMGAVYVVFDRELCRELALKRIHPEQAGQVDCEERFRREYRALASICDPGVPQVYHSGRTADGAAWFTMEIVRGEPLRTILDRGAVTPTRALDLAIDLGKVLVAAHAAGVIHRDVKPNNVMIEPGDRVRLLDFGVCTPLPRFLEAAEPRRRTADVDRWESGEIRFAGTYGYSDPATHDGTTATVRSDIFSLAAILYELITGRRLYDADNLAFRSIDSAEFPLALAPLADDLRRAAAPNPFERQRSMSQFVQRLEIARGHMLRAALEAPPRPRPARLVPLLLGLTLGIGVAISVHLLATDRPTAPAAPGPAPAATAGQGDLATADPGAPSPATAERPDPALATSGVSPPAAAEPPDPTGVSPPATAGPPDPALAADASSPATAGRPGHALATSGVSPPTTAERPGPADQPAEPGPVAPDVGGGPVSGAHVSPAPTPTPADARQAALARAHQRLDLRRPAITACVDDEGSPQRRLAVLLDLDITGAVRGVRLASGEHSGLSRCVAHVLSNMSLPPGLPTPLRHTFELERP